MNASTLFGLLSNEKPTASYGSLATTDNETDGSVSSRAPSGLTDEEGLPLESAYGAGVVADDSSTDATLPIFQQPSSSEEQDQDTTTEPLVQTLHEITHIPVPDEHGHLAHYPGENEHPHADKKRILQVEHNEKVVAPSRSLLGHGIECFKALYSMCLLIVCFYAVMAAIFSQQTVGTVHMSLSARLGYMLFFLFLAVWLAEMEGSQSCLVGLQPIDKGLYAHSHSIAHRNTTVAHTGDNMGRFLVGRQFLIVLVVFVTNMMSFPIKDASIFGLNDSVIACLLGSGVAATMIVVMLGQAAQINAANCMLDFINSRFTLCTTYLSLFLDMSGFLHAVYLVEVVFAKITNTPIETEEPPRNAVQNISFWARVALSCGSLVYFSVLTLAALHYGQTTMWEGVPEDVSIVLLLVLLGFVGVLEGLQIALFAVVNLPADEIQKYHPTAAKSCELAFRGSNLQAFLIGRQMCVTLCMFVVARITTCDVDMEAGEETVLGMSRGMQHFFNTGLPGAVITTVIGSLAWRLIASNFPVAFLSNPIIYPTIRLCLIVEHSGVCSAAWWLALIHKKIMGYHLDEVYIGTPQERSTDDKNAKLHASI